MGPAPPVSIVRAIMFLCGSNPICVAMKCASMKRGSARLGSAMIPSSWCKLTCASGGDDEMGPRSGGGAEYIPEHAALMVIVIGRVDHSVCWLNPLWHCFSVLGALFVCGSRPLRWLCAASAASCTGSSKLTCASARARCTAF
jgi:hypothetical protein